MSLWIKFLLKPVVDTDRGHQSLRPNRIKTHKVMQIQIYALSNAFPNNTSIVSFFVLNPTLVSGTVSAIYFLYSQLLMNHSMEYEIL